MSKREILTEITLSTINPQRIISGQKIRIDGRSVIAIFPDTDQKIWKQVYHLDFLLSNCKGIVAPNKNITIGKKRYNGRLHFLDLKKHLMVKEEKTSSKKLAVYSSLSVLNGGNNGSTIAKKPSNVTDTTFFFYDMSIYSKAFSYMIEKFPERITIYKLFDKFKDVYKNIKDVDPTRKVYFIFTLSNTGKLADVLAKIRMYIKPNDLKKLAFFDDKCFIKINDTLFPIFYKEKSETKLVTKNVRLIKTFIEDNEEKGKNVKINDKDTKKVIELPNKTSTISKMSNELFLTLFDAKKDNTQSLFNEDDLFKVLKKYKIKDPDVINNFRTYLEKHLEGSDKKPSRQEIEMILFKSLHYTVHGDKEIEDEYLANPEKLLKQLSEADEYKVPLKLHKPKNDVIDPKDIVDLDYTTGQFRQKFEFENKIHENVKKLFKSLEDVSTHKIKVVKIKHDVIDDNKNRLIKYTVTLKNVGTQNSQPYDVELHVPGIVNDRYFKINGNEYIMSSQHFLKPITKTDKNAVRLLSNYGTITIGIKNLKFNPTDLEEIINYITVKYPTLIKEKDDQKVIFNDDSILYTVGNLIYSDNEMTIRFDPDSGDLVDDNSNEHFDIGRYEFIFDIITQKVSTVNPEDKLTKTKKSIPYFYMYLSGITMPLIYYLWSQKGLLHVLNDFGIDYEMVDERGKGYLLVPTKNNQFLAINPKNIKQKLLVNGLMLHRIKKPIDDLDNPDSITQFIVNVWGTKAVMYLKLQTENFIDPVTKEILQFEGLPTTLTNLCSTTVLDKLMNGKIESLADLSIYRARMSEMVLHSMYKKIKAAHSEYVKRVESGDKNAKLFLIPNQVIVDIVSGLGVLENAQPTNPVDEIMLASKVIKTGLGGVPNRKAIKPEHRNIHPSQYGIISANSTPESANVGMITKHTLTPVIINRFGSYGQKDITKLSGWHILSLDETITPFQNQMHADRLVMAVTHAKQVTPINNRENPIVATGAEYIVPQLSSSRFVHKAKLDGKVIKVVKNKIMTVRYKNGQIENLDIIPRKSRTKRGVYISLEMETLEEGKSFKKNQIIAWTKNFSEDGLYAPGKNVFVALMNYDGFNHEDAYAITRNFAEQTTVDVLKEQNVIIPPEVKIIKLRTDFGKVKFGETLVEFKFENDLEDYLELNNLDTENEEDVLNTYIKSSDSIRLLAPEGEIVNIEVYINNRNLIDSKVLTLHKKLTTDAKKVISELAKGKNKDERIKAIDNMNLSFIEIGNHKWKGTEFRGARIVYYIKQTKPIREGDKIANRYGAKGVVSKLLDKPPKGEYSDHIDVFLSPVSLFGRQNTAMIKEMYIGKIFYYLNKRVKDLANVNSVKTEEIVKLINDIYSLLCSEKVAKSVEKNISSMAPNSFRKLIKDEKFMLRYFVEPFNTTSFENIKEAADMLGIPLDEKVYLPEFDTWTKESVPVGVSYYLALEHHSDVYSSIRGSEKYQSLTGQPTKGKSRKGGQGLGWLDLTGLITAECKNILNEQFTLKSDDHLNKRKIYNDIIRTGELPSIPKGIGGGKTGDLMNIYITGLGLQIK